MPSLPTLPRPAAGSIRGVDARVYALVERLVQESGSCNTLSCSREAAAGSMPEQVFTA